MSAGRQLQPGDEALTDFNDHGPPVRVRILERLEGTRSQSGISFRVRPALRNCHPDAWIDADWFKPAKSASGTRK